MIAAAEREHPREACGVIAGGVTYVLSNRAKEPEAFFAIDLNELRDVYARHGDIEAVWHSHPEGAPEPSKTDWDNHPRGKQLIIVANGEIHAYDARSA